jgi:hypothetical protein
MRSLSRSQKYRKNTAALALLCAASHSQYAMVFLDRVFHECESQARAGSSFGRKEAGFSGVDTSWHFRA